MAEGNHFLFFWEVFSKTETQNSPEKIFSRFFNQKEGLITVHGSGLPGLPSPSSVKPQEPSGSVGAQTNVSTLTIEEKEVGEMV